eukprot:scaffold78708_cov63-Phaeocystis_antarctica.AAC.2
MIAFVGCPNGLYKLRARRVGASWATDLDLLLMLTSAAKRLLVLAETPNFVGAALALLRERSSS